MSEYLIKGETLTAIADAIRESTGKVGPLDLTSMTGLLKDADGLNFRVIGGASPPSGDTLTWDGKTPGLVEVLNDNGLYFYKISELIPTFEDVSAGATVITNDNQVKEIEFTVPVEGVICDSSLENCVIVSAKGVGVEVNGYVFKETGIYFSRYFGGAYFVASLTISGYNGFDCPKTNDIWVNSTTAIKGWAFSNEDNYLESSLYMAPAYKQGYFINSQGGLVADSNFAITEMVDVRDAYRLTITAEGTSTVEAYHQFYDGELRPLSHVLRQAGTVTYKVPAGAVFLRISRHTDDNSTFMVENSTVPEGFVSIRVGTSSPTAFNALKKNGITIYPLSAQQYVGKEWVDVEAKSYQNGEWVTWIYELYLYNYGNISEAAGEFVQTGVSYGGGAGSCTITKNGNNMTVGTYAGKGALAYFSNKINLTNFKKLYFNGSAVNRNSASATSDKIGIGVWKTIPTSNAKTEASAIMEGFRADGIHELSIENCSGEHYVGIAVHGFGTPTDPYSLATIKQLWLK